MRKITTLTATIAVLVFAVAIALSGTAAADNHADHSVSIETETLTTNTTETVEVTITNNGDSNMVSPLVEIPLRNGLSVADENREVISGTEFIVDSGGNNLVTVTNGSGLDKTRSAFIDDSTLRNSDAVFVEGVEVPVGESRTYGVPLDISGSSEITIEADTRPLNFEDQNNRTETTIDPISEGTIAIESAADTSEITVSGGGADRTVQGSTDINLPGNRTYTVNTTLSDPVGDVSLDEIELDEFDEQPVAFDDPDSSEILSPAVVAETGGQADVVGGSSSRSTSRGTAEQNTTQTVVFDLSASGGQTIVVVGTEDTLPMNELHSTENVRNPQFNGDAALVETEGPLNGETLSVTFEGRKIGDTDADGDVDAADAEAVADTLATGGTPTQYADVTDSGSISAIDAMQIQQYNETNRNPSYVINGGI